MHVKFRAFYRDLNNDVMCHTSWQTMNENNVVEWEFDTVGILSHYEMGVFENNMLLYSVQGPVDVSSIMLAAGDLLSLTIPPMMLPEE